MKALFLPAVILGAMVLVLVATADRLPVADAQSPAPAVSPPTAVTPPAALPPAGAQPSATPPTTTPPTVRLAPPTRPQAEPESRVNGIAPASRDAANDPTIPSPEIRSLLQGEGANTSNSAPPPTPAIRLRARVIARGKPGAAMLDVGGALATVREGDELNAMVGSSATPIRVVKITATEVLIEIGTRKQLLTVN